MCSCSALKFARFLLLFSLGYKFRRVYCSSAAVEVADHVDVLADVSESVYVLVEVGQSIVAFVPSEVRMYQERAAIHIKTVANVKNYHVYLSFRVKLRCSFYLFTEGLQLFR